MHLFVCGGIIIRAEEIKQKQQTMEDQANIQG